MVTGMVTTLQTLNSTSCPIPVIKTCKLASQKEATGVNSLNCYLAVEWGRPEDYICCE